MSYKARKHNRELTIPEEKAEEYAQMGYTVTDHNGKIVVKAALTSVADANKELENTQKENAELKERLDKKNEQITFLEEENAELKKENAELKEKLEKQAKKPSAKAPAKTSTKDTDKDSEQAE